MPPTQRRTTAHQTASTAPTDGEAILHRAPVVLPIASGPIRDGAVEVRSGRVSWVGSAAAYRGGAARVHDWPGVLTPGLVNAHAHLQYTDFADLATGDVQFHEWMMLMARRRAAFTDDQWRESTLRGVRQALATGTTCVADVVSDAAALAPLMRSGLAGTAYVEVVAADDALWVRRRRDMLLATLDGTDGATDATLAGPDPTLPGRLTLGVSPHTPYTLGTAVFAECVRAARQRGLRLHPHLAETAAEVEYVHAGTGPLAEVARRLGWDMELLRDGGCGLRPGAYLDTLDGLGPDVHVAHGIHLDAADRALLRERGTAVALCPRSNAILRAGEPPVADYRREGNQVAVGTDSLASSPSLDLLADVAALRRIALAQGSPAAGLDRWLVEAATLGGARAVGLADGAGAVGTLAPGTRADLAVFDVAVDGDPYTALVEHGAGRCVATVLAGALVYDRAATDVDTNADVDTDADADADASGGPERRRSGADGGRSGADVGRQEGAPA